jgi:two-component system, OmpR family, response regulator MprA
MRALVVDCDSHLVARLMLALDEAGYDAATVDSGEQAVAFVAERVPNVLLLNRDLPDMNGLEVCRRVRLLPDQVRILMFSHAAQAAAERVRGLNAGADAYLGTPLVMAEVVARLRAMRRRDEPPQGPAQLTWQGLRLDPGLFLLEAAAGTRELTQTEYRLLELFMLNPERLLSHAEIKREVWGSERLDSAALRVYIGYVRRKLQECGAGQLIHTIQREGYVFR